MRENFYWVMVTRGGQNTFAIGPFRTREGAERRAEKSSGGQVDVFKSWESDAQRAVDEYKNELVRSAGG